MFGLQEILENQLAELAAPKSVLLRVLNRRFEELGVLLTSAQQDELAEQIMRTADGTIHIECEDDQIIRAGFRSVAEVEPLIRGVLNGLSGDIEKFVRNFEEDLPDMLQNMASGVAPIILTSLRKRASKMLAERRSDRESFRCRVSSTWRAPLDLLETHLTIAIEVGQYISETHGPAAMQENDVVFDVLTRLHARACQISWEILTLLENGFADGAHARWRSLHEVTTVANLIAEHDATLAERYLLHEGIESYAAARQYRRYWERLGLERITDEEMDELTQVRDQLIKRFGADYGYDYGWAANVVGKRRPTFADIEEHVKFDHLRPFYRLASYNVHANAKGVFVKLGILGQRKDVLLAGPSDAGLDEPGHAMAMSLAQITICLLTHESTFDTLVISRILLDLVAEVGDAFAKTHGTLTEEESGASPYDKL